MTLTPGFDPVIILGEVEANLRGLAEFWLVRAGDPAGGYQTVFDAEGAAQVETVKTLVAQTRILWTTASLSAYTGESAFVELADYGVDYLIDHFHDPVYGGWYWSIDREGPQDPAKLMYGQTFALYALATCATITGNQRALEYARHTFDVIHQAADLAYGGFWENIDRAWAPEDSPSGRRKSLDIHLHLLESFTTLAALTGEPTHRRRLAEIRDLVLRQMIDPISGVGGNQYDAAWRPIEPIVIDRTWIAERLTEEAQPPGQFTTSYGHNLELGWLLGLADEVLDSSAGLHRNLVDHMAAHTLRYGYDVDFGGVYREGPPRGPASDTDKEFWQNAEALVGFLHAYELTGKAEYSEAFAQTWSFAKRCLIHPTLAEWRIRTTRSGTLVDASLGNQWTGGYHTVRAALESQRRLTRLVP
ncbi:MAG: AGE family epimerase/isomerase [Propionibacteriaceae bacterium]|jgi:mannobiose 2-epimerase|nr:AGE family epimerase/isomerase [Propionibacteriaceae bacterium]